MLCGAIGLAFPGRPIIGYFANPLMSYVPQKHSQFWLGLFRNLCGGDRPDGPLLPLASTRFLAQQMRYQTGAPVFAVRPVARYIGPPRGAKRPNHVVVVRAPSVFWNSACVLNALLRGNEEELGYAYKISGSKGIKVPGMRFFASEDLQDGASEAFAAFDAAVIFPYDVSQMRLYELYALGVPIFLPDRKAMPCYIYRGMTTIEDFDFKLPLSPGSHGFLGTDPDLFLDRNPFDRWPWYQVTRWTALTHWMTLPYLLHCRGTAHMLMRMVNEDLRPVTWGMRKRQDHDVVRAVRFWTDVFAVLRPSLQDSLQPVQA